MCTRGAHGTSFEDGVRVKALGGVGCLLVKSWESRGGLLSPPWILNTTEIPQVPKQRLVQMPPLLGTHSTQLWSEVSLILCPSIFPRTPGIQQLLI